MRKFKQKKLGCAYTEVQFGSCFTALFMALCISACSDDDDAAKVVFPLKNKLSIVVW